MFTNPNRKKNKERYRSINRFQRQWICYICIKQNNGRISPGIIKSITADNGAEFSTLGEYFLNVVDVYFAHPYSAFERDGNENFNKLIRQFIPKGTSIDDYDRKYIENIVDRINNTPRKILGYQTANEAFNKEVRAIIKQSA